MVLHGEAQQVQTQIDDNLSNIFNQGILYDLTYSLSVYRVFRFPISEDRDACTNN